MTQSEEVRVSWTPPCDLFSQEKPKKLRHIHSIEEWTACFNTYISVIALREPQQVPDLYSILISHGPSKQTDYLGTHCGHMTSKNVEECQELMANHCCKVIL